MGDLAAYFDSLGDSPQATYRRAAFSEFQDEDRTYSVLRGAQDGYINDMRTLLKEEKGWAALKSAPTADHPYARTPVDEAPSKQVRAVFRKSFRNLDSRVGDSFARRIALANAAGLRTDYQHVRPQGTDDYPLTAWLQQMAHAEQRILTAEDRLGLAETYIDDLSERLAIICESLPADERERVPPRMPRPSSDAPF